MTTADLERSMVRRLKDGQKIDPRVLARLDDAGPVGAGCERVPVTAASSEQRTMSSR